MINDAFGNQILEVHTKMKIAKPPHEVFEAIVDPEKMSGYFISSGSGRLEDGKLITWVWEDFGAELPIQVKSVETDKNVIFLWPASGVETLVEISLEPVNDSATIVHVSEKGWERDETGIKRFGEQMQGWVHMLTCLKGFLEYGINLRKGCM